MTGSGVVCHCFSNRIIQQRTVTRGKSILIPRALVTFVHCDLRPQLPVPLDKGNADSGNEVGDK